MPRVTGLLESALYVADVDRSVAFYREVFDFEPMFADERLCALAVAPGQVLLLFLRHASTSDMPTDGGVIPAHDGQGQLHFALSCTADELPKWKSHLAKLGIELESEVRWPRGGTSIYFRDPDENLVEIATPGVWPIY